MLQAETVAYIFSLSKIPIVKTQTFHLTKQSDSQIFIRGNVCNCKATYFLHCFENIKSRRAYGRKEDQTESIFPIAVDQKKEKK